MQKIRVTKRNGCLEELDSEKINKVLNWACETIQSVSPSQVALGAHIQLYDKISTADIHKTLISSAANLISEEFPNYQYVGGRLINFELRKQVYKQYQPISLYDHITNLVKAGFYTSEFLHWYTEEEINEINGFIDHDRDIKLTHAAMEQITSKYLVQKVS